MKTYTDTPGKALIGPVRMSYANTFKPRKNDLNDKTEFSAVLLIPKTVHKFQPDGNGEAKAIQAMIKDVALEGLGSSAKGWKNPLKDGDLEKNSDDEPRYPGHWYMTVKSSDEYPPKNINAHRDPFGPDSPEMKLNNWQSGDWAKVQVKFATYNNGGNKGVGAYLSAVQWLHKDEPFSSSGFRESDFDVEETNAAKPETDPFADE